jgi:hypothetical protein
VISDEKRGGGAMRRLLNIVVFLSGLFFIVETAHAEVQLDKFLKDCEKKTVVMGYDEKGRIVKVGEDISGYCHGVLEGVFAVLVRTKEICVKDRSSSPEFLLSTVLTYRTETKSQDNDASAVIEAAYRRAFNCRN